MPLKFTPMASSSIAEGFAYFDDSLAMGGSLDHELIEYTRAVVASSDVYRIRECLVGLILASHDCEKQEFRRIGFFNTRDPNRGQYADPYNLQPKTCPSVQGREAITIT